LISTIFEIGSFSAGSGLPPKGVG
jgi:hypothetical protein